MKALLRMLVGLAALVSVSARGADNQVRVQGSQELRLAIVDSNRASAARDALHQAFADGLAAAINQGGGEPIGVRTKCVNPDHAAFNLGTGVYDAVLVIGTTLPRPLILSETTRLTATLSSGKRERKAFLIFGQSDQGLTSVLTAAFTPAITDQKFLDTLDGGLEPAEAMNGGSKVAARP